MKPLRAPLASVAVATVLLLTACTSPDSASNMPTRDPAMSRDWMARRAAELKASGLNDAQAAAKARSDFVSRFGYEPETYTLYDSGAKARAEQKKINEGLEKLQRDRSN